MILVQFRKAQDSTLSPCRDGRALRFEMCFRLGYEEAVGMGF